MTDRKTTTEETAATCVAGCTCNCPKDGCSCEADQCQCGCRQPER